MYVIVLNILAYAHDTLMAMLYYSKTLGRRYSMKTTSLVSAFFWILLCAGKLPAMYLSDDYNMTVIMVFQCGFMIIYLLILYKSSFARKLLAFFLMLSALGAAEFTSILIVDHFFETGSRILETGSTSTAAGLLITRPLAMLAYYAAFQVWNILQRSTWVRGGRQWLCVILPLSQTFLFWYLAEIYLKNAKSLPLPVLAGVFMAFASDIYMCVIFDQAQKRELLEQDIRLQNHLHDLERIHYERLRKSQEETACLRHDFQNYLLALRSMHDQEEWGTEEIRENLVGVEKETL